MQLLLERRESPEYKRFRGLTIFTDSSYSKIAQDQAHRRWYDTGVWVTSEGKMAENVDLLMCSVQLRREIQRLGLELDIQLVPGHRNVAADTLSKAEGVFENFKLVSRIPD
jgi:ribonuclease HI